MGIDKTKDFSEWYNDVVEKAGLCDKRYPVKGMNIWTPYGWKIMQLIDGFIREEMARTHHEEVQFPLVIPETEFAKEKEHIKGFDSQVYWVTHAGNNPLDIRLCLRPTSETAIYPIFKLWIRSHADLPMKIYQIVSVYRYETKQTRSFMRVREIHFFESHTCHADYEDAERQMAQNMEIMKSLSVKLCLPYIASIRPEWDKFAGAHYSIGVDAIMPTGRTLQIAGIHQYKDNFAKPFEITYEDENGNRRNVHQTTYGMSERLVGAVVAVHGDDKGIVLPPEIAPVQVIVVPIPSKGNLEIVNTECDKIAAVLSDAGIRTHVDKRDLRPGNKFYDWELKGVPLRLEIGGRDIADCVATAARRDTSEKKTIPVSNLVDNVRHILNSIAENLLQKAAGKISSKIVRVDELGKGTVENTVLEMYLCGSESCGQKVEQKYDAAVLGTPVEKEAGSGRCIVCGLEDGRIVRVARTY